MQDFDNQITREWLITNGRGGYASGTVVGVPTRRYHGWLVASARPPLERWLLLSSVLERASVAGQHNGLAGEESASESAVEFASFEFARAFHPSGFECQTDFTLTNAPPMPQVRFVYERDGLRLTRRIILPHGRDEAWIAYRLDGPAEAELLLELCPFVAMRDFHGLTRQFESGFAVGQVDGCVCVDAGGKGPRLWLQVLRHDTGPPASFEPKPDWWYGFTYREELARGSDHREDLYVPGWFRASGTGSIQLWLRAVADFTGCGMMPMADTGLPTEVSIRSQSVEDRLSEAARAFVVTRRRADETDSTTILAGYHWFGDWGRDSLIALPGLLLETQRFGEARQVLETFASAQKDGLIPNRFSDYDDGCDYNSVDASLWFFHAADAYCRASGDTFSWDALFGPVCERVAEAFQEGTLFNIHMDVDGLIACGDAATQLTWMDAKCDGVTFTPRYGKPVEINALWYHALCILALRIKQLDPRRASGYAELASRVQKSFTKAFWNDKLRCLYDVVQPSGPDAAIRPNQIFSASLPNSPLSAKRQQAIVACVRKELLTPYGLRSLSPRDPAYRGRYEGGPFERDGAYHQGTVWAWLIGPYVEAYLRVNNFSAGATSAMRKLLLPLIDHLDGAGIGSVSEIFDGEPPHKPRGCIAQAWSVAELFRAWRMTQSAVS